MRLCFQLRMTIYLIILYLFCMAIFGYLYFAWKLTWFWSLFLGLLPVSFAGYLIFRNLAYHVRKIIEVVKRWTADYQVSQVPPLEELTDLSRSINEISDQFKKKIAAISEDKEYLQTILKGMVEGVLVVNEKKRIKIMNEALRSLLDFSFDYVDKTPLEVIRHVELESSIQRVLQSGNSETIEIKLLPTGQKTFAVNVVPISSPHQESKGKIGGAIAVFHDISQIKSLEKIRQDFVANVSHELRTPLTLIKGYAETLLEGALKEDIAVQFIQVIKKHADRLTKLVEDLLTLSKFESKEFSLKPEYFSFSELINSILDVTKEEAEKKGISISWEVPNPSYSIFGDRKGLEQVLINLLDNAIKYGREGGQVKISVTENSNAEIQVSIQDDGMGIPKEDLPRIFERFYRVDKGRSKELGGTGLGLSIVKHIIQAHGGKVWAESQIGHGSTFYFVIPRKSAF